MFLFWKEKENLIRGNSLQRRADGVCDWEVDKEASSIP